MLKRKRFLKGGASGSVKQRHAILLHSGFMPLKTAELAFKDTKTNKGSARTSRKAQTWNKAGSERSLSAAAEGFAHWQKQAQHFEFSAPREGLGSGITTAPSSVPAPCSSCLLALRHQSQDHRIGGAGRDLKRSSVQPPVAHSWPPAASPAAGGVRGAGEEKELYTCPAQGEIKMIAPTSETLFSNFNANILFKNNSLLTRCFCCRHSAFRLLKKSWAVDNFSPHLHGWAVLVRVEHISSAGQHRQMGSCSNQCQMVSNYFSPLPPYSLSIAIQRVWRI